MKHLELPQALLQPAHDGSQRSEVEVQQRPAVFLSDVFVNVLCGCFHWLLSVVKKTSWYFLCPTSVEFEKIKFLRNKKESDVLQMLVHFSLIISQLKPM